MTMEKPCEGIITDIRTFSPLVRTQHQRLVKTASPQVQAYLAEIHHTGFPEKAALGVYIHDMLSAQGDRTQVGLDVELLLSAIRGIDDIVETLPELERRKFLEGLVDISAGVHPSYNFQTVPEQAAQHYFLELRRRLAQTHSPGALSSSLHLLAEADSRISKTPEAALAQRRAIGGNYMRAVGAIIQAHHGRELPQDALYHLGSFIQLQDDAHDVREDIMTGVPTHLTLQTGKSLSSLRDQGLALAQESLEEGRAYVTSSQRTAYDFLARIVE